MLIFAFLFFLNILQECSLTKVKAYYSIITIKINSSGRQKILFDGGSCDRNELYDPPDEIIINNARQYTIQTQYDFETTNNVIQLKWNQKRENWGCLFKYCRKINEIDFSQFDFSQNIHGNKMLFGCSSVTSLNINDFGKVKLIDAGSFFRQMSSLTSLNLSNFDMSGVTDIGWMFQGCTSLTSLDLTCLQTNSITEPVNHIFWECPNLEYINLNNTQFIVNDNIEFILAKKNLVFCNQDEGIIAKFSRIECPLNDCSESWRQNQKKLIFENDQCVDDCSSTTYNKYNYNNKCYNNCPNGTYNNNFKCEDCHPHCRTCNKESFELNLCLSCNDNYYPKYNDSDNIDNYINFYQSPEGYYLDKINDHYKPCYESCKICDGD